jgi:[acyl-carrier-protein] S-malonyltransferase
VLTGSAFVFPGQGSQYPGMARDLAACGPEARALVHDAEQRTGVDLTALMATADARTLADPRIAQLLVFVASSALLAELRQRGAEPGMVAGHSLGEYSALVACGSLDWSTALELVSFRGTVMAEAAGRHPGTMVAVAGLDLARVQRFCDTATQRHGIAVVANLNSARQLVVSGSTDAVLDVLAAACTAGALRAKRLPVGGAYHSPLMATAEHRLAPLLRTVALQPPRVPFVSSVTGELVTDIEAYRAALITQVTRPVRWQDAVRRLASLGAPDFVEVGPGRVLTGLGRETARGMRHRGVLEALRGLPRGNDVAASGGNVMAASGEEM